MSRSNEARRHGQIHEYYPTICMSLHLAPSFLLRSLTCLAENLSQSYSRAASRPNRDLQFPLALPRLPNYHCFPRIRRRSLPKMQRERSRRALRPRSPSPRLRRIWTLHYPSRHKALRASGRHVPLYPVPSRIHHWGITPKLDPSCRGEAEDGRH